MESPEIGQGVARSTEYYYDTLTEQLIIGRTALDVHIASGGHPADVDRLENILVAQNGPLTPGRQQRLINAKYWASADDNEYIQAMQWLESLDIMPSTETSKKISRDVIRRAGRIGLIGGLRQISARFNSLSQLYQQADVKSGHRRSIWRTVDDAYLVSKVKQLASEIGRSPTFEEMASKSRDDRSFPHPKIFRKRFGSWTSVLIDSEIRPHKEWRERSNDDFTAWGEKVAEANDGLVVTERIMSYFHDREKFGDLAGPNVNTAVRRFNSFGEYQYSIESAMRTKKLHFEQRVDSIRNFIQSGQVPLEVFSDQIKIGDKELVLRHSRYLVIKELGLSLSTDVLSKLCRGSINGRSFEASIRKQVVGNYGSGSLYSPGYIESTAFYLGVYDDIWPPNKDYLKILVVPERLLPRKAHARYAVLF